MRISSLDSSQWSASKVSLVIFIGLFLSGCSTRNDSQSYVAILPGAEDGSMILKVGWNSQSHQISDTLYFLSPMIDNMRRLEYSDDLELAGLFHKYQPHPIYLLEREFRGDSLLFRTAWFPMYDDSLMFHFQGVSFPDSAVGSLGYSVSINSIERMISDTNTVRFKLIE